MPRRRKKPRKPEPSKPGSRNRTRPVTRVTLKDVKEAFLHEGAFSQGDRVVIVAEKEQLGSHGKWLSKGDVIEVHAQPSTIREGDALTALAADVANMNLNGPSFVDEDDAALLDYRRVASKVKKVYGPVMKGLPARFCAFQSPATLVRPIS